MFYFPKSLNSGNRLFWGALKFSWYFSATAELLPSVVKQSSAVNRKLFVKPLQKQMLHFARHLPPTAQDTS